MLHLATPMLSSNCPCLHACSSAAHSAPYTSAARACTRQMKAHAKSRKPATTAPLIPRPPPPPNTSTSANVTCLPLAQPRAVAADRHAANHNQVHLDLVVQAQRLAVPAEGLPPREQVAHVAHSQLEPPHPHQCALLRGLTGASSWPLVYDAPAQQVRLGRPPP